MSTAKGLDSLLVRPQGVLINHRDADNSQGREVRELVRSVTLEHIASLCKP